MRLKKLGLGVAPPARNVKANTVDYTGKFLWERLHEEIKYLDGWLMRSLECGCICKSAYFCRMRPSHGIIRDFVAIIFMALYGIPWPSNDIYIDIRKLIRARLLRYFMAE